MFLGAIGSLRAGPSGAGVLRLSSGPSAYSAGHGTSLLPLVSDCCAHVAGLGRNVPTKLPSILPDSLPLTRGRNFETLSRLCLRQNAHL